MAPLPRSVARLARGGVVVALVGLATSACGSAGGSAAPSATVASAPTSTAAPVASRVLEARLVAARGDDPGCDAFPGNLDKSVTPSIGVCDAFLKFTCSPGEPPVTMALPADWEMACDDRARNGLRLNYELGPAFLGPQAFVAAHAAPTAGAQGWVVDVRLAPSYAALWSRATAFVAKPDDTGGRIAIMLDGRVLAAPRFTAAQKDGSVELADGYSKADAARIAAAISRGAGA